MSITVIHTRLADSAALFTLIMGLWGLALAFRGRGVDGSYLGAIVVGELLLIAEALLGAYLLLGVGVQPGRWVHILYGVLAVLIWPFVFTYTRDATGRREAALFGIASLFLWGLVMRASTTAIPGAGFIQ